MTTEIGMNRTGAQVSPIDSKEAEEAAVRVPPSSPGDEQNAAEVRVDYAREAPPIGSVPPPGSVRGVVTAVAEVVRGKAPAALVDKLGERLAFERSGTRLYELLIAKHEALGSFAGGPSREDLVSFHDEEARHFALLRAAIERIGADPTATTPAADIAGVEAMGLFQVISDPRTSLVQSLDALLIAELADNDGWRRLIDMARAFGQDEMVDEFTLADLEEQRHLEAVRRWLDSAGFLEARGELEERPERAKAA